MTSLSHSSLLWISLFELAALACDKKSTNQDSPSTGAKGGMDSNAGSESGGAGAEAPEPQTGAAGGDVPSGGTAGTGGQVSAVSCAEIVGEVCSRLKGCVPLEFATQYGDEETCAAALEAQCQAFSGAASKVDLSACAAAIAAPDCHVINAYAGLPIMCQFPKGDRPGGTACGRNSDCASLACEKKAGCGTCTERGAVDAPCDSVDACNWGLLCNVGKCAVPVKPGDSCDFASDNRCPGGTQCVEGQCKATGSEGDACGLLASCNAAAGYICSNAKCAALAVADEGDACSSAAPGSVCGYGLYCSAAGGNPACVARLDLGEPCEASSQCAAPLSCSSGQCGHQEPDTCEQ